MQGQLLKDFPDLLLENCSSGGARFDAGMLFYSPQIWTSDDTDAIERLAIQEGTALVFPVSTMGAHVSVIPNQQTGREVPFNTRAKVAMAGTFGYELDIRNMDPEETARIPDQVAQFRKIHPVNREGDYYRIASFRENHIYDCWMVVTKDRSLAYMTYVQVLAQPNRPGVRVRMQGLDPEAVYEVSCDYRGEMAARNGESGLGPQTASSLGRFNGDTLMKAGIIVPRVRGDYQALLYEVKKM
jgi:alpha-galactosidase